MFTVKKGEYEYIVKECSKHWSISMEIQNLTVKYKVDKETCPTAESVESFIKENFEFIGG